MLTTGTLDGGASDHSHPRKALDYATSTYARSRERLSACINILIRTGRTTKYDSPGMLHLLGAAG